MGKRRWSPQVDHGSRRYVFWGLDHTLCLAFECIMITYAARRMATARRGGGGSVNFARDYPRHC